MIYRPIQNYASNAHWGYTSLCDICRDEPNQQRWIKKREIDTTKPITGMPQSYECDNCGGKMQKPKRVVQDEPDDLG